MHPRLLVFGHRGARAAAPENTVPAFEKALELGADGIELDVRLTADQAVVVIHDARLERTTDGAGTVERCTQAEIAALDAGSWFDRSFRGTRVPTLEEVLEKFAGRTLINVELKPADDGRRLAERALALVAERNALDSVIVSSFHLDALAQLRASARAARIGVLFRSGERERAFRAARSLKASNLHAPLGEADQDLLDRARAEGLQAWVWTANEPCEIDRLIDLGVEAIFSDHPERVREALERRPSGLS